MMNNEYILCAAIWYMDLPTSVHLPKNVDKGMVVCGHRHHNCISTISTIALENIRVKSVGGNIEGFLTNKNRFVGRIEAMDIALKAQQTSVDLLHNPYLGLFSEDLY